MLSPSFLLMLPCTTLFLKLFAVPFFKGISEQLILFLLVSLPSLSCADFRDTFMKISNSCCSICDMVIQKIQWHMRADLCRTWASTHMDSFLGTTWNVGFVSWIAFSLCFLRLQKKKTWKRIPWQFWPCSLHYKLGSSHSRLFLAELPLTTFFKTSNEEPWMSVPAPQLLTVPSFIYVLEDEVSPQASFC